MSEKEKNQKAKEDIFERNKNGYRVGAPHPSWIAANEKNKTSASTNKKVQ